MSQSVTSALPPALSPPRGRARVDTALAWYFVIIWGASFIATKAGLRYVAPFTFLSLRYLCGIVCLIPMVLLTRPAWPSTRRELFHVCVAGILMHAVNLGMSHYSQYLGMPAGITALVMGSQPLLTAVVSHWIMGDRLGRLQWLGVGLGLIGVAFVVWHKISLRAVSLASLASVGIALAAITTGTLYQRRFCRNADLRSASLIQFVAAALVLVPSAFLVEGFVVHWSWALVGAIMFLVMFTSILGVNALHLLMRRGHAAKVTSLFYFVPVVAVLLEWLVFGVVPAALSAVGFAVTCVGFALVTSKRTASARRS